MTMSRINNDDINICLHKCIYTGKHVGGNTNSSSTEKTSLFILWQPEDI